MNARIRNNVGQAAMSSVGYLALMALLVLVAASLFAPLQSWRQLNRDLSEARTRLDELQVLYPLYTELAGMDNPAKWPGLSLPVSQKLSETEVLTIPDRFALMATHCLVELGAVSPRVETDDMGRRYLAVNLRATGPYRQLKAFLMELVQMPVLEVIERLEVRRETLNEEFNVSARLALE